LRAKQIPKNRSSAIENPIANPTVPIVMKTATLLLLVEVARLALEAKRAQPGGPDRPVGRAAEPVDSDGWACHKGLPDALSEGHDLNLSGVRCFPPGVGD